MTDYTDDDQDKKGNSKLPSDPMGQLPAKAGLSAREMFELLKQSNASGYGEFIKVDYIDDVLSVMYGEDQLLANPESIWAINPASLQVGFVTWADKKTAPAGQGPLEEIMKPFGDSAPYTWSDCKQFENARPSQQNSIMMKGVTHEDRNQLCVYKTSSQSGRKAIMDLYAWFSSVIGDRLAEGYVPLVRLEPKSKKNEKYGGRARFLKFQPLGVYTTEDAKAIRAAGSTDGFTPVDAVSQH